MHVNERDACPLVRSQQGSGWSLWIGSRRAIDPRRDVGGPGGLPAVDGEDQLQQKVGYVVGMVDGIMDIAAQVVMHMAMGTDRFDDGADGVRMRVGCHHRSGEQRRHLITMACGR